MNTMKFEDYEQPHYRLEKVCSEGVDTSVADQFKVKLLSGILYKICFFFFKYNFHFVSFGTQ